MLAGFCKDCGQKMKKVLHFENGKSYSYFLCKNCQYRTKPSKMDYREFVTEKVFDGGRDK